MVPVRSLHIVPSLDRGQGGLASAALGVCQQLAAQGHPVEMVTSHSSADHIEHVAIEYPDVRVHYLPRTFPQRFSNCASLPDWLVANRERFDIVEIHGVFMFLVFNAAAKLARLGIPYLVRPHGSLCPFDLRKKKQLKKIIGPWLTRGMLQRSAGVVSACNRESELLVLYGAQPARYVVPLPVPMVAQVSDEAAAGFRAKHGIPPGAFVVLFLSRLHHEKGLDFLIPALASLKQEFPNLWLVVAGGGKAAFVESVREEVANRGMSAWTVFPGFVSGAEKMAAFRASDLFALPSQSENFGIVVVEAMQCGLPTLISTGVYIHREIAAKEAAVVCEPSMESCRSALRSMLSNEGLRGGLHSRSTRAADELYSPRSANRQLLEIYHTVLESHGTRAAPLK